jgi:hypothetical protein
MANRVQKIKDAGNPHIALKEVLALELNKAMEFHDDTNAQEINVVKNRLESGYYHDFITPVAMPKAELKNDLEMLGLSDVAQLVVEGIFDEDTDTEWNNLPINSKK